MLASSAKKLITKNGFRLNKMLRPVADKDIQGISKAAARCKETGARSTEMGVRIDVASSKTRCQLKSPSSVLILLDLIP